MADRTRTQTDMFSRKGTYLGMCANAVKNCVVLVFEKTDLNPIKGFYSYGRSQIHTLGSCVSNLNAEGLLIREHGGTNKKHHFFQISCCVCVWVCV